MADASRRTSDDARELAQDIFVRVYQRLGTFHGGDSFLPWLLRLARNACIDALRRQKSRPPATDIAVEDAAYLAAAGPSPEDVSESRSSSELLYRAMDRMSAPDREILMLKEIQV